MLSTLKRAFTTLRDHQGNIDSLRSQIAQRDQRIAELEAQVLRTEKAAHHFTEEARYSLETAAEVIEKDDPAQAKALATIAYTLPYVFAGRRHWDDLPCSRMAEEARAMALQLTRQYGFELPDDPVHAVRCLFRLSITVLKPELSLPVEHMRNAWPAKQGAEATR